MNIGKLGNSEKLKFPFWVEGTFGDGWGQEGQMGVGVVEEGGPDGRGRRVGRGQGFQMGAVRSQIGGRDN